MKLLGDLENLFWENDFDFQNQQIMVILSIAGCLRDELKLPGYF